MGKAITQDQYIHLLMEDAKRSQEKEDARKYKDLEVKREMQQVRDNMAAMQANRERVRKEYNDFSTKVRNSLLCECLLSVYKGARSNSILTNNEDAIVRNMINQYIEENGAVNMLRNFKTKNIVLSEMSQLVESYYDRIIAEADKTNPDTFKVDPIIKDDFFKELDMEYPEDVVNTIRTRVADATSEFITNNASDREDIKFILTDTKNKVDSIKTAKVESAQLAAEAYEMDAKRKIGKVRNRQEKNVFSCMVESMARATYANEDLKYIYADEKGRLDMDKIVESCEVMYTFLETMNTLGAAKVNEEYIQEVLSSMK